MKKTNRKCKTKSKNKKKSPTKKRKAEGAREDSTTSALLMQMVIHDSGGCS